MRPKVEARLMILEKASMAMMKINGDRGSPYGTPRSQLNSAVGDPFIKIADRVDERIPFIHLSHISGNTICCIMEIMKSQCKESKAFSKSILKTYASLFHFLSHAIISFSMSGPSSMFLSERKAV